MSADPTFLTRARLWAAIASLIPPDKRDEANDYAATLETAYCELIEINRELYLQAQRERDEARAALAELPLLASPPGIETKH